MAEGSKFWKHKFNLISCDTVNCGISAIIYILQQEQKWHQLLLCYTSGCSHKNFPQKINKSDCAQQSPITELNPYANTKQ